MAYALQFDGVNDYAELGTIVQLSGDFEVEVKFEIDVSETGNVLVLRTQSAQNQWIGRFNGNHLLYWGGNLQAVSGLISGTTFTYTITRVSGTVEWRIDGVLKKTFTNTSDLYLRDIFKTDAGQFEYLKITDGSTLIHNIDATASSHATGTPVLTDTVGGNDATGVNMPTDGSAWINLGGGSVTLDAENGSFTTTLQPATLIYDALNDYVIDTQSGSFLTSGQDVDLLVNRVLSSEGGSYLTTFNDSTLVYNTAGQYTIVANNGAFNTTGSNVSLLRGRNLSANTGDFTYTGQDVNLLAGRKIQALSGNYTTTGQDVSFLYNRVIISQSGDFITTGYNVSLLYSGQEVQTIGTVTAGFKQDIYTAIYKPNSITVSFKD